MKFVFNLQINKNISVDKVQNSGDLFIQISIQPKKVQLTPAYELSCKQISPLYFFGVHLCDLCLLSINRLIGRQLY